MLVFFWACTSQKIEEQKTGEELLEAYYNELCLLYTDRDCGQELSQCGEPVTLFSDWGQCMNTQNQRTSLCGLLPAKIEENPQDITACLSILQEATCTAEEMCSQEHLLFDGVCGAVEDLILQECNPY